MLPSVRGDLEALVRIPSVSAAPDPRRRRTALGRGDRGAFRAEGFEVEILTVEGGAPGRRRDQAGAGGRARPCCSTPTTTCSPSATRGDWDTEPFEPTERGDRLYGRGAADDKAGIAAHLAAVRAHGDDLPVGVTVLVEGEEEIGSPTLEAFLAAHRDRLRGRRHRHRRQRQLGHRRRRP